MREAGYDHQYLKTKAQKLSKLILINSYKSKSHTRLCKSRCFCCSNKVRNLPQRNNNPGNLKSGGLADNLATGTDSQGHLIFLRHK